MLLLNGSRACRRALMIVAVLGWLTAAHGQTPATTSPKPPNFVFILVDDLRWDAMSCMDHPFVKTPNIDRIATSGVRFANAFVTTSLCAPARASFLTGTYSHTNGVRTNEGKDFDPARVPSFAQVLQKAGYETAFVGKWHMAPNANPRPGFDYWLSFRGQGKYIDPDLNEDGRAFKAKGYMTDLLTDSAVEFIKRPRSKPFSLCLWHKAVHGPFTPADRHAGLYADAALPEPASFRDTFEGKPQWQARRVVGRRERQAASQPVATSTVRDTWDGRGQQRLDYFRALAAVDDSVGRVFAALKETGALDNTVILFAGDNGYFHGEHRRGDKRAAYEESIRIPLLMCGPGIAKPGSVPDPMILNIDVAPTLLDLAGIEPPATMQGRSFKPILAGAKPDWRSSFFYAYYKEGWLPAIPTMFGVRTTDWKYVEYPEIDDVDELYDLRRDPHEMHNLATAPDAKAQLAAMQAELARLKKETGFTE
ncbi:MAG: sulfatase [Phycisphaerae bacterium]|nr:sulfatase [Phycisphaerae bacterium]